MLLGLLDAAVCPPLFFSFTVTVTAAFRFGLALLVTVTTAFPAFFPVTFPPADTVATPALEDW